MPDGISNGILWKLETTGSILTHHAGGRKISEETIHDAKERLLTSPSKSPRKISQETNLPYPTCERAAKIAKLRAYRESCVQELLPIDHEKRVRFYLWIKDFLTQNPRISDYTFFTDKHGFIWADTLTVQRRVYGQQKTLILCMKSLCIHKNRNLGGVSRWRIIGSIFF
jgi:hypothetical protein